jgi:hypothetical protein
MDAYIMPTGTREIFGATGTRVPMGPLLIWIVCPGNYGNGRHSLSNESSVTCDVCLDRVVPDLFQRELTSVKKPNAPA